MKFLKLIWENILLIVTLFLLAFIPLYPKLPLFDIQNTWVYIRVEDFVIAAVLSLWIFLVLFKKVKLKTPLTIPIFLFWVIGALSTLHGVLILFPQLSDVFSNVAFLSFIRRVEYLSLFFIAFSAMRDKKFIYPVIAVLTITLFLIVVYGIGQKFLGFPAYLTMNEEFAKGVPIQLSQLSRVPSTFAGHYDLAAYLVLIIPIFVSLVFGFRKIAFKILFLVAALSGFALLFTTVSRISFFALLASLIVLLILQKQRFLIVSLFVFTVIFLIFSPSLVQRFGSTLSDVNVLVNARTGQALGEVKELPREYFADKVVLRDFAQSEEAKQATSSSIMPYSDIPPTVQVLMQPNASTGESLPQGTGYVNLQLSPVMQRTSLYFTEIEKEKEGTKSAEVRAFIGNFLVKKARAYDLSFTTRFQGEWPKTIEAFKRNIFIGSGYGSVSLAVDNNYLRILGESGLFGLFSFLLLFIVSALYIKKTYRKVESPIVRSFTLGFVTGTFGLLLNGILIDVFEASKIAFSFWLLMGVTLGILHLYSKELTINLFEEVKKVIVSPFAVAVYLLILTIGLFLPLYGNYFVGDDFTWLRWAAEPNQNVFSYFVNADGFFYRPGAKLYFFLMYKLFWLNQTFYHLVSILLHFSVAGVLFLVLRKILKDYSLSIIATVLFLILSGHNEAVFWISSTGFLFTSLFTLLALLSFIYWKEKRTQVLFAASLIFTVLSMLFHELGVVTPLILIAYDLVFVNKDGRKNLFNKNYLIFLSTLLPYLVLRFIAQSHWQGGDYSYNLIKFPLNFAGNTIGYFLLDLFGSQSLSIYENLRNILRENLLLAVFGFLVSAFLTLVAYKKVFRKIIGFDKKIISFSILFFILALLPFLGLGNLSSRYSYLSSIGFAIVFAYFAKKSWDFLLSISDKYTNIMIAILLSMVFLSLHLFQLQNSHNDWKSAGEVTKRFLVSFEEVFLLTPQRGIFRDYSENTTTHFYFVKPPLKKGEAWIFPVGLKDALWLALKNKNFTVDTTSSLDFALDQADILPNSDVFQFEEDGTVRKVFRIKNNIMFLPE